MKLIYLLAIFILLILNGCSDFSSETDEFVLSGKMYACDENVQGDIINDAKAGKKQYCNGYRWEALIPEDSEIAAASDTTISKDSASADTMPVMYECKNGIVVKYQFLCNNEIGEYLPLDDTEYPYAGIPRIVIETENHQEIKDRETEIPAKLQIWGEKAPESKIMELTIRGRGNTSWEDMPKKSYKIEFKNKQAILGMPKDKDWALIANYADKTLIKNYLMYNLSHMLGAYYAPRSVFVDLFLNKEYLGVYQLTEIIKFGKNRINIPNTGCSYLVEIDKKYRDNEQKFFSSTLQNNPAKAFRIHEPHNITDESLNIITQHINKFEQFLKNGDSRLNDWISVEEAIKHYWVQELSKNPDADFSTSVYFTWTIDDKIQMGPVWDFDLSMGGYSKHEHNEVSGWHIKNYWYAFFFQDSSYIKQSKDFWKNNNKIFESLLDSIDQIHGRLQYAAQNNFKRWDILSSTEYRNHPQSFENYSSAMIFLRNWIDHRIKWIDSQLE